MNIQDIEAQIKKTQNSHRFRHTMGVQYTSICLAMRYEQDIEKASYAGLLHDCAKQMRNEELLEACLEHQLPVSRAEMSNPFLLHGKVGAWMAEHEYGIQDQEILNAVIWHTTGHPDMSMLEKIVFTADYIEPGRDQAPNLSMLRHLAFTDLDRAVCYILKQTLDYLHEQGGEIDPKTEETYRYYKQLITD